MLNDAVTLAYKLAPSVDYWSLRIHDELAESLTVRQDILQPVSKSLSYGAFLSVVNGAGMGYAATNDITSSGLARAFKQAQCMAELSAANNIVDTRNLTYPEQSGEYKTPVEKSWESSDLADKIALLQDASKALKIDPKIVDWQASLKHMRVKQLFVDSREIRIAQDFHYIVPGLIAVANKDAQTQVRSGGGAGTARQGGLEQLDNLGFPYSAEKTAQEALQLLDAPECPSGKMDLLLMPSQMILQIHESIGHPLELDRILGDERNYAGTSFVTLDMFGTYRYGSKLLNVSFDPTIGHELASYGYDDDGFEAKREYIIRDGILQRPLGSSTSQIRANCSGVANARASAWNRPSIDRMANLNLEPGDHSLQQMIESIENGVLMRTNRSWSIDDSRNKFQFGCEVGQVIKDGELTHMVRNPNYRGISANFWRNLSMVGNHSTFEVYGTPNCGKGEPNQLIKVGHASPACVFTDIEVFGGS